jgi:hypothetical protein
MNRKRLAELADLAVTETPFTKLSLDNLGNEESIRRRLEVEFEKHLRAKDGVSGLTDRIQKVMGETLTRAKTIAQTERTRALNGTRVSEAIRQYLADYDKAVQGHRKRPEVPVFQWVNPLRAREPRHMHVAISGDRREVGEEFLPGLRYPGDPNAPPSETINCHCYVRRVN